MKLRKPSQPKQNALNLPVEVTGFAEENGNVGVAGTNLLDGSDVKVFLTDRGKAASNSRRPTLEKLKDGFKIGRNRYQLEPGGLVVFKASFPQNGTNKYISQWPNVMAYNKESANKYVGMSENSMLDLQRNQDGKYFGALYTFIDEEDQMIEASTTDHQEVHSQIKGLAEDFNAPAFMIRFVNENNEVEGVEFLRRKWHREESRPFEAEDYADHVMKYIESEKDKFPENTRISIVPAERFIVSPLSINGDESGDSKTSLPHFQAAYKSLSKELDNGEVENMAKTTFFQMGGDNGEFVNSVHVVDPFGEGHDPVLIGGLSYSPHFSDEQMEQESQTQNHTASELEAQDIFNDPAYQAAVEQEAEAEPDYDELDSQSFGPR